MVRFWSDPRDIKLAIMETMSDFGFRTELAGWIPATETISSIVATQELERLAKENEVLREQLIRLIEENSSLRNHPHNKKTSVNYDPSIIVEPPRKKRNKIFYSYSHQDSKWLEKILRMLSPLIRDKQISIWSDQKIKPGEQWKVEINEAIASAEIAVLLVSQHFLASEFIAENELPPLLSAAEADGLIVLWIALDHCLVSRTKIIDYQAANDPSQPLKMLSSAKANKVIFQIAQKIIDSLSQE